MVAADQHDRRLGHSHPKSDDQLIEQPYRLRRRHGLVINIPGDHDSIRLLPFRQCCHLLENIALILQQIPVHHLQPDM